MGGRISVKLCASNHPSLTPSCSDWSVFITLQSVDGEDLRLAQARKLVENFFTSVQEELGGAINITEVTRFGKITILYMSLYISMVVAFLL